MPIVNDLLDFLLPRHCFLCQRRLTKSEQLVCIDCLSGLPRTNAHLVDGNPIEKLYWKQLPIERATSFFYYDALIARLAIYNMKYFDHPRVGQRIAEVMTEEIRGSGFFDGIDLIVPVPLHWKKAAKRGYNQSEYLAKGISKMTGLPVATNVVEKIVNNESQTHMTFLERRENVRDAFRLRHPELIEGKHVLLVDDVITTDSTTMAVGRELARAAGVRISILSMCYAGTKFIIPENIRTWEPTDTQQYAD